uniref:Putative ASCH domain-containing protein n=1 Tax=viral metagenome TaxID=1070528 RepID=A0A6M3J308_9ZZZZ
MKALSIRQPWAWLICKGFKNIENRDWHIHLPPLLNYPAKMKRIYVHASTSKAEMTKGTLAWILKCLNNQQASELMLAYERLTYGAIIGEVDITGCTEKSDSPWFIGKYGFTLANPVLYERPIPCKGKLGFFEPGINLGGIA